MLTSNDDIEFYTLKMEIMKTALHDIKLKHSFLHYIKLKHSLFYAINQTLVVTG